MTRIINCDRCKHADADFTGGFLEPKMVCRKDKRNFDDITDNNFTLEMEKQIECDEFKSRYIEYPLEISGIKQPKDGGIRTESWSTKCGTLVKVRPAGDKYENKTYLGIFIGEADIGLTINHNPKSKELTINRMYNPAIFVPELKEIIYGMGSWWGKIKSEDELKEISNDDIQNVWYMKMLNDMQPDESETTTTT